MVDRSIGHILRLQGLNPFGRKLGSLQHSAIHSAFTLGRRNEWAYLRLNTVMFAVKIILKIQLPHTRLTSQLDQNGRFQTNWPGIETSFACARSTSCASWNVWRYSNYKTPSRRLGGTVSLTCSLITEVATLTVLSGEQRAKLSSLQVGQPSGK